MDFIQKMCDSGYNHPTRMEVILCGVKKYYRQVVEQESGGRRLYRSQEDMASSRKLKNLRNKTWYKNRRGGSKVTPSKDLPWHSQVKEKLAKETSNMKTEGRKIEEHGELQLIKNIEIVVFIPTTPGSLLRKPRNGGARGRIVVPVKAGEHLVLRKWRKP